MLAKKSIDIYEVTETQTMNKEIPNKADFYYFADKDNALKFFHSQIVEHFGQSLEFSDPDENILALEHRNKEISLTSPDFSALAVSDSPNFPHYSYVVYVGIQMTDPEYNETKRRNYFPENVME